MLVVDKKTARKKIEDVKGKLSIPGEEQEGILEIKKLLAAKESSLQQIESCASCCGGSCSIGFLLEAEAEILKNALEAMVSNDVSRASLLLEDYLDFLESNYGNAPNIF